MYGYNQAIIFSIIFSLFCFSSYSQQVVNEKQQKERKRHERFEREERKRFALASHEYLIHQVQRIPYDAISNTININLVNFTKPVTDIYFVVRRTDMEEVNEW